MLALWIFVICDKPKTLYSLIAVNWISKSQGRFNPSYSRDFCSLLLLMLCSSALLSFNAEKTCTAMSDAIQIDRKAETGYGLPLISLLPP
jgi:hypothetical protein